MFLQIAVCKTLNSPVVFLDLLLNQDTFFQASIQYLSYYSSYLISLSLTSQCKSILTSTGLQKNGAGFSPLKMQNCLSSVAPQLMFLFTNICGVGELLQLYIDCGSPELFEFFFFKPQYFYRVSEPSSCQIGLRSQRSLKIVMLHYCRHQLGNQSLSKLSSIRKYCFC